MAARCYDDPEADHTNNDKIIEDAGFERVDTADQDKLDELFGEGKLEAKDFDTNEDTGSYADLFHNEKTGKCFVAFRGSEFNDPETDENQIMQDWVMEDGGLPYSTNRSNP